MPKKRSLRWIWWVIVLVLVVPLLGFTVWAEMPLGPAPEAANAMQSDERVSVSRKGPWLIFEPKAGPAQVGFVFYPGARVAPESYAPMMREIAANGYLVVIVPMRLNMAVFSPDRAEAVVQAYPVVQRWAIGGHSLGGAMAGHYVYQHPGQMAGVVFWAAYPPESNDLSHTAIASASISGTADGLATQAKVAAYRHVMPATTEYVQIEGGNHAQFGWYGPQSGDNAAVISPAEQTRQIVAATVRLLEQLK